jgi:peptidoglycan/LPS O-acetylase OafA/YrhL
MFKEHGQPAERKVVDGPTILAFFCLGGAALALWLLARFPTAGPRRPFTIMAAVLAVMVALSVAGELVAPVIALGRFGPALALLAIVLPSLTGAFWVSGCALRALAGLPGLRR